MTDKDLNRKRIQRRLIPMNQDAVQRLPHWAQFLFEVGYHEQPFLKGRALFNTYTSLAKVAWPHHNEVFDTGQKYKNVESLQAYFYRLAQQGVGKLDNDCKTILARTIQASLEQEGEAELGQALAQEFMILSPVKKSESRMDEDKADVGHSITDVSFLEYSIELLRDLPQLNSAQKAELLENAELMIASLKILEGFRAGAEIAGKSKSGLSIELLARIYDSNAWSLLNAAFRPLAKAAPEQVQQAVKAKAG